VFFVDQKLLHRQLQIVNEILFNDFEEFAYCTRSRSDSFKALKVFKEELPSYDVTRIVLDNDSYGVYVRKKVLN